jgi:nitrite reductase/ring-hydroxylating ferredoxin subunit
MARYVVGTVDEIPPGGRKLVELDGRSIGVFNVGGEFFALRNRCPHQGGELCKGRLSGLLAAPKPGQYELTRPGEILRCPWHGWEFDIRTGQSYFDPRGVRVRRYDVRVAPGAELAADAERPAGSERSADAEHSGDEAPPPIPGTTPADLAEAAALSDCPAESPSGMAGLVRGPYIAETYPVVVEQRYLVVEIGGASHSKA